MITMCLVVFGMARAGTLFCGAPFRRWLVLHHSTRRASWTAIENVTGGFSYRTIAWLTFTALTLLGWIIFRCSQSAEQLTTALTALTHPSMAFNVTAPNMRWIFGAFLIVIGFSSGNKRSGRAMAAFNLGQKRVVACAFCALVFDTPVSSSIQI